jgi:hypothetical protein
MKDDELKESKEFLNDVQDRKGKIYVNDNDAMIKNDQPYFIAQKSYKIHYLFDEILNTMLDKNKTIPDFEHFSDICNYFIQKLEGFVKNLHNV